MRKRVLMLVLLMIVILGLCSCEKKDEGAAQKNHGSHSNRTSNVNQNSNNSQKKKDSTFSIQFIDVGQGDSALVECDGHYMLIDGGDTVAGDKVYDVLEEKGIQQLDILAISHLHADHIGGLIKALKYASSIGLTISNADYSDTEIFKKLEHELHINDSSITVPAVGTQYELGSAIIEVVDVSVEMDNDSLVLLITYGDTRFLFTGDIEAVAQKRIYSKYENEKDEPFEIDLIKMPHHGSKSESMYVFLRTFMPKHAVISVGKGNIYGHPDYDTLDKLENADVLVYRTDLMGDIIVTSNGKELLIQSEK